MSDKPIKQIMEENGFVEITENEYKYCREECIRVSNKVSDKITSGFLYFKRKPEPKFPKVFEDDHYKIIVKKNMIEINSKHGTFHQFDFSESISLPILTEAVKYWEENKNG